MKQCEKCGFAHDDGREFADCPVCAVLDGGEGATPPEPSAEPQPPEPQALALPIPSPLQLTAAAAIPPPPGDNDKGGGENREDGDTETPRRRATEPASEEERNFEDELSDLREKGTFSIALVGFYEGGKTWFMNRLKYEGRDHWGWGLDPRYADQGSEVARTDVPGIHHIIPPVKGKNFAIIDVPGDLLKTLVRDDEDNPQTRDQRLAAGHQLIRIMNTCHALVIALPADQVLLSAYADKKRVEKKAPDVTPAGEDLASIAAELKRLQGKRKPRAEADELRITQLKELRKKAMAAQSARHEERLTEAEFDLTAFIGQLVFLVAMLSLLRKQGKQAKVEEITVRQVRAHMQTLDFDPLDRPTFVALTKADQLRGGNEKVNALIRKSGKGDVLKTFDRDPLETVQTFRRDLAKDFKNSFRWHKFDFVSAFAGHSEDSKSIDYNADCFGIHGVIEWIMWVADHEKRAHMDKSIARARKIRARRDGWAGEGPLPPAQEGSGA